ncbi:MAG: hypothetical protein ACYDDI_08840 [Candidatus Acidiferrales bacterium]
MKKLSNVLSLAAVMLFSAGLASTAHAKNHTWMGWISDSSCGAKGMSAGHKACAEKCVKEKGASYVFVNAKTKKVYAIQNQDAVTDADLGQEVKLTGGMNKNGTIRVDSIKASRM